MAGFTHRPTSPLSARPLALCSSVPGCFRLDHSGPTLQSGAGACTALSGAPCGKLTSDQSPHPLPRLDFADAHGSAGRVRRLAQPETIKLSFIAAGATALACYPRFALWSDRHFSIWYLEAMVFLCATILWGFVFAWHRPGSGRPVFTWKLRGKPFAAVTAGGLVLAILMERLLDPTVRQLTPEDYPGTLAEWCAMVLFTCALTQLFLVFAPFAWLLRLFRNTRIAAALTIAFGVLVLAIKAGGSPQPYPLGLLLILVLLRVLMGSITLWCYWQNGVLLAWWFYVLLESRHLFHLTPAGAPS